MSCLQVLTVNIVILLHVLYDETECCTKKQTMVHDTPTLNVLNALVSYIESYFNGFFISRGLVQVYIRNAGVLFNSHHKQY